MKYVNVEEGFEHSDHEWAGRVDRAAAEEERLAAQKIKLLIQASEDEEEKMLYCFQCHTSQLHSKCADGRYKCPNCGMKRKPILKDFNELLAALQESDFTEIAERGTHGSSMPTV